MRCPFCGSEMPEEAAFCLNCFKRVNHPKTASVSPEPVRRKGFLLLPVILLLLLCVIPAMHIVAKRGNEKAPPVTAPQTQQTRQQTEPSAVTTTAASTTPATTTTTTTATTTTAPSTTAASTTAATTEATTERKTTETTKTTTKKKKATPSVTIKNGVLTAYPNERTDSYYAVPYSVKAIAPNAFAGNKYLKSLRFSKRKNVECDYKSLVKGLPNLKTVYICTQTTADIEGIAFFKGKRIVYYD